MCILLFSTKVTDLSFSVFGSLPKPWKCSCWCKKAWKRMQNAGRGCFFFRRVSKYAYALHFIGTLHPSVQKLHYEQQPRQNVRCLCPCWAHKRTLNWVIQWQVRKDVTGVLEQGDTLALQKSALWVNNVPCYQFGHAAKVNVKTHWSTHSSAFAAANRAAERKQVSFLHCNNRMEQRGRRRRPGTNMQICLISRPSMWQRVVHHKSWQHWRMKQ